MPENRARFVLLSQQALALAVVAAVGVSAANVVELRILPPSQATGARSQVGLVSTAPVEAEVRTIPLGGVSVGRSRLPGQSRTDGRLPQPIRVLSPVTEVTGYGTVGITWAEYPAVGPDELGVELRTRTDGAWTPWEPAEFDPDHQPDPGTEGSPEAPVRSGTDAVAVGEVDAVQARVTVRGDTAPRDLSLAVVDPGEDAAMEEAEPALDTGALDASPGADADADAATLAAAGGPPRPEIFSRAQWGADERIRDKGSLRYGEIHAAFVHHTVNANDYDRDDVPAILRGIYAYHVKSRGWSDIGYNFLVDRFGRIWEGRYGGIDKAVVGAHTLGYNEESFAMSAIGNYEEVRPSQELLDAYASLFAWKLSLAGIAADDPKQWVDDRYFKAINGHRDADSTACPGRYLYARLPDIRTAAAAIQNGAEPNPITGPGSPLDANVSGKAWPDLVVRDADTHRAYVIRTKGQLQFDPAVEAAGGWAGRDLVAAAGDLDGDGWADLVARSARTREARLFRGTDSGQVRPADVLYAGFRDLDQLTGVGDFDGDGHADLVGRRAKTHRLVLFAGRGDGTVGTAQPLAEQWEYDLTAGVDDLDGNGRPDLVARADQTLWLVPGTGRGLGTPVALPGRWDRFDLLAGRGDVDGDGRPDLLARHASTGTTYVYPSDGHGGFGPRVGGWARYAHVSWLALGGRLAGSGRPDLVAVGADGTLKVYAGNERRNLGRSYDTGAVLDDVDLLLNVGDWNRDGRGDVITRQASTGALQLRAGLKGDRLADPVVAATGWGKVTLVAAVGDVNGDGNPDLVGRAPDGTDRVYPGNGRTGFKDSYVSRSPIAGTGQVGLGFWDTDTTPDTAVRRSDGSLWLRASGGASSQLATGLRRYDWMRGLGDLDGDGRADLVVRARATGYLYLLPGRAEGFGARRLIAPGFAGYDLLG